ncbi:hypothetical protein [Chelativorans salis]|uniref:Uncharacterized protein n=1 Tax=Chelativorans salis TaxID=2978478 RepID=A0ABT2LLT8_9HYPH|nr:hypothetical protein [Chelativorans sp. EGI FJ00035]MCT7375550.1 hypothetical protein [Chelativorans sp. EGI FJ00035]
MKVVIEFNRIRASDGAHATVGRVTRDVIGAEAAVELAASLLCSLAMPQEPDVVRILDDRGNPFYCAAVGSDHDTRADDDAPEISLWENEGGAVASRHVQSRARDENFSSFSNSNEVSDHDTQFSQ